MLAAMRALPPRVDVVELRLDLMESVELERLCSGKDRPVIATNRPVRAGGGSTAPEKARLAVLRRAAELGADFVDVEADAAADLGALPAGTGRIISHHDYESTPPDLDGLLSRLLSAGPDVAKLAVTARDVTDVAPVLRLLERRARQIPLIAVSMGEAGMASRVLAAKFGAFLSYASRAAGAEAAAGQVPVADMLGMYRFHRIGPATALYGVVAKPVAHSMSPAVHNAAFDALGLDAVYLPFKVTDVRAFLEGFEPFDLRGLSVTIPHKEAMLALVDDAEDLAARIGAVNTVTIRHGRRYGCNTDVGAALGAVERAVRRAGMEPLSDRRVLILGAGGAARAIAYGLRAKTGGLTVANRTVERARRLGAELGAEACSLDEMPAVEPDVLVNCTSVGMWPRVEESPVPRNMLRPGMVVFDCVYNPVRTRLLREAEAAGAVTVTGLEWFLDQAAAQCELWTGRPAPRKAMEQALAARLG
jgi:3-dehydroquinate dehydratase/shikimate dehydrogenase